MQGLSYFTPAEAPLCGIAAKLPDSSIITSLTKAAMEGHLLSAAGSTPGPGTSHPGRHTDRTIRLSGHRPPPLQVTGSPATPGGRGGTRGLQGAAGVAGRGRGRRSGPARRSGRAAAETGPRQDDQCQPAAGGQHRPAPASGHRPAASGAASTTIWFSSAPDGAETAAARELPRERERGSARRRTD